MGLRGAMSYPYQLCFKWVLIGDMKFERNGDYSLYSDTTVEYWIHVLNETNTDVHMYTC